MKLTLVFGKRNNLCPHIRCPFGLPMCRAFSPDACPIGTAQFVQPYAIEAGPEFCRSCLSPRAGQDSSPQIQIRSGSPSDCAEVLQP